MDRSRLNRAGAAAAMLCVLAGCSTTGETPPMPVYELATEMSRRIETITLRDRQGDRVPRFNQAKTVACVTAEFKVHAEIPNELRHGVFADARSYPAYLRFANATQADDAARDIRGLSIRLSDVDAEVLWGEPGKQDFLLNSYPALFVATPEEFLAFIRAREQGDELGFFLNPFDPHLKALWTVFRARARHLSPLDIRYWSTVPFRLGEHTGQAVKYSVTPCSTYQTEVAVNPGKDQLRSAVVEHLRQAPACLHFGVQLQTDPEAMPIEDASVVWDEDQSPFIPVATITIPDQAVDDVDVLARCERSRLNPWQSLPAHAPLGRMNAVRRQVYDAAADVRNATEE